MPFLHQFDVPTKVGKKLLDASPFIRELVLPQVSVVSLSLFKVITEDGFATFPLIELETIGCSIWVFFCRGEFENSNLNDERC